MRERVSCGGEAGEKLSWLPSRARERCAGPSSRHVTQLWCETGAGGDVAEEVSAGYCCWHTDAVRRLRWVCRDAHPGLRCFEAVWWCVVSFLGRCYTPTQPGKRCFRISTSVVTLQHATWALTSRPRCACPSVTPARVEGAAHIHKYAYGFPVATVTAP